jgi:opacity protein-like surface antigen
MMMMSTLLLMVSAAFASVDEQCADVAAGGTPEGYSDQGQQDFLLNYFALATTFSPLHAPIPHEAGNGAVSLEASMIPPLSCERRLVLNYTKTEDTNKAPVFPRFRASFAFNPLGKLRPYAGVGYVPPLTVFGTRNVIVSGELGFGVPLDKGWSWGLRTHTTLMKTVAEIATPFNEEDEPANDLYVGSTFGLDLMAGKELKGIEPYLAVGLTDVSTFFYIGDDAVVSNNGTPYFGPTTSLGLSIKKVKHLDLAAEYYGALYNFKRDNDVSGVETEPGARIHTLRTRIGYRW